MAIDLVALNDFQVLALTLYGEARGEPFEGIVAVGNVIRNRAIHENKTYKEICIAPLQFSCWNSSDPNYSLLEKIANILLSPNVADDEDLDKYFVQCRFIAFGIFYEKLLDNTNGALNYLTESLFNSSSKPAWADSMRNIVKIGNQVFGTAV